MDTTQEQIAGRKLAFRLQLRRDPEHKDRWLTEWGTKTDLGLWRTVTRMVDELRAEAESLPASTPSVRE